MGVRQAKGGRQKEKLAKLAEEYIIICWVSRAESQRGEAKTTDLARDFKSTVAKTGTGINKVSKQCI